MIKVEVNNYNKVKDIEIDFFVDSEGNEIKKCNLYFSKSPFFPKDYLSTKEYINKILNTLVREQGNPCTIELIETLNSKLFNLSQQYWNPYIRFSVRYDVDCCGLVLMPYTFEARCFILENIDIFNKIMNF